MSVDCGGLISENERLRAEVEDDYRLITRQGELLTGVVDAIRGREPGVMHSHHDAPDLVRALVAEVEKLRAEVESLRATNRRLNRRATEAEGQVRTTIEDCRRQGVSLGRGLANAGYAAMEAERDAALNQAAKLQEQLDAASETAREYHGRLADAAKRIKDLAELSPDMQPTKVQWVLRREARALSCCPPETLKVTVPAADPRLAARGCCGDSHLGEGCSG